MGASLPSASRRGGRSRRAPMAEINVTPLVDVMLVLLIIFMVAAPMLQRGVELKLPVASKSDELSSERIFIDVPLSYRKEKRVFLDKESIGMPALAERLRQLMVNRSDKQVFLRMDSQLFIQEQIDVMQELKAAGILNVGIVTELPTR